MEKSLTWNVSGRKQSHMTGSTSYTTKPASKDLKFAFVLYVFVGLLFANGF